MIIHTRFPRQVLNKHFGFKQYNNYDFLKVILRRVAMKQ